MSRPLPTQVLEQRDYGAFPQIVRVFLEGEAHHAQPDRPQIELSLNRAMQMLVIAGKNRFEHRQLQVQPRRAIFQGAEILGQAGSSKSESGLRRIRRTVPAGALAWVTGLSGACRHGCSTAGRSGGTGDAGTEGRRDESF